MKVVFLSRIRATEIATGDKPGADTAWQTDDPFYVQIIDESLDKTIELIIPKYFITDFCSVPRIPFAFLLYGGIANRAGLTHDALYSDWPEIKAVDLQTREPFVVNRAWADQVLYAAVIACYVPQWKAWSMWLGVKAKGWQYFKCKPPLKHGIPHLGNY